MRPTLGFRELGVYRAVAKDTSCFNLFHRLPPFILKTA